MHQGHGVRGMRFISTTLVLSLLAFSLSANAREITIFGGFTYLDTETTQTSDTGDSGEASTGLDTVTSGSRTGFGAFVQSFEDDGFYVNLGFQRTDGEYDVCVVEDCTGVNLAVDDVNVELGWSRRQWTPFLEFTWSDIESQIPSAFDTETDLALGIGSWYQFTKDTKIKFKISGLNNGDSQSINAGFQRSLQSYFTIDGSFTYPLTQDVTGYGFRFAIGWTIQP